MDKSWRNGVLLCAMVARWRPDVIDMNRVKQSSERSNVELAQAMAERHLKIRPLLEVWSLQFYKTII